MACIKGEVAESGPAMLLSRRARMPSPPASPMAIPAPAPCALHQATPVNATILAPGSHATHIRHLVMIQARAVLSCDIQQPLGSGPRLHMILQLLRNRPHGRLLQMTDLTGHCTCTGEYDIWHLQVPETTNEHTRQRAYPALEQLHVVTSVALSLAGGPMMHPSTVQACQQFTMHTERLAHL